MSIVINDSLQSNSPKSIDNKYLKNGVVAYADVTDVNNTINSAYRSVGLTVLIGNKEYWYRDGVLNANLIPKSITSASAPLVVDAITNNLSIVQSSAGSNGYLTSGDWTTFNAKLSFVSTANSIMNSGTSGSPIQLINDSSAPGNSKYYGTDSGGVRGYFNLPAGTGTVTSVALTVPTGLSITGSPITSSGTLAITTALNGPIKGNGTGFTSGAINLTSEITGILPIANGGTNASNANSALNNLLPTQTGNNGKFLSTDGTNTSWTTAGSGSGTVTTFSAGSLSPLFSTSVSNATTTPALSFIITNAAAHTFFGNFTGSSAAPSFSSPALASADFANQGTTTTVLHGNASGNPSWSAISLTTDISGTLPATNGGTGQSTFAIGDILYASTTTALSKLADVATGNALISGGVATAPSWGKIGLTTHVTGTLPVANGGTGTTTPALVAGTNITITGTWPNQTINSSGGSSQWTGTTDLYAPVGGRILIGATSGWDNLLSIITTSGTNKGIHIINTGTGGGDNPSIGMDNASEGMTLFLTNASHALPSTTGFFTGSPNGFLIYPFAKKALRILQDTAYFFGDGDGGKVGFGLSTPTAKVHFAAGSATAGTAAIKINSGTLLTTPEDGAIEYSGTHIYGTIGSTRYQLDQQTGSSTLTSVTYTSNTTAGTGDLDKIVFISSASGNVTYTITPSTFTNTVLRLYGISTSNIKTISLTAGTINGASTYELVSEECIWIYSNGTNLFIISRN